MQPGPTNQRRKPMMGIYLRVVWKKITVMIGFFF